MCCHHAAGVSHWRTGLSVIVRFVQLVHTDECLPPRPSFLSCTCIGALQVESASFQTCASVRHGRTLSVMAETPRDHCFSRTMVKHSAVGGQATTATRVRRDIIISLEDARLCCALCCQAPANWSHLCWFDGWWTACGCGGINSDLCASRALDSQ